MIGNVQEMRALVHELATSVWTLATIGTLFEAGLVEALREPRTVDELADAFPRLPKGQLSSCLAVAAAASVVTSVDGRYRLAEGVMPLLSEPMRSAIAGEIRSALMQSLAFLNQTRTPAATAGWRHTNPVLLQAQGDGSGGFPPMFKANIVPSLGDLAERLERPEARFLDVGVGVASLAIAMCRAWPALRVVGLDVFDVPLSLARANLQKENLSGRVELRQIAVEDLRDEEAFDVAWLPGVFIPAGAITRAVERVRASLRPGGWILFPVVGETGEVRHRAVWRMMNELWGGPNTSTSDAEALMTNAGFGAVRVLPGPAWAPSLVVGQR